MLADYYSKHHPVAHHRNVRGEYHTTQAALEECRARTERAAAKEIQANLASITESADLVVHNSIQAQIEQRNRALALKVLQQDAKMRALEASIRGRSA